MDSVFGIGPAELVIILLLAGIVMGPRQIRRTAQLLGYWTGRFQQIYRQFVAQINHELDAADARELKEMAEEVKALGQQMNDIRRDLSQAPRAILTSGKDALSEVRREVDSAMKQAQAAADGAANAAPQAAAPQAAAPPAPPKVVEVEDDPAA